MADQDFQISGRPGHPDPEIRGEGVDALVARERKRTSGRPFSQANALAMLSHSVLNCTRR